MTQELSRSGGWGGAMYLPCRLRSARLAPLLAAYEEQPHNERAVRS